MKTIVVLCMLLSQSVATLQSASPLRQQQKQRKPHARGNRLQNQLDWRAGNYLGLTAGKSTWPDVLRVFGEPKRIDTPADQTPNNPHPEVWYVYDSREKFAGELTVVIDKRTDVMSGINLNPASLSKEEAVKHLVQTTS